MVVHLQPLHLAVTIVMMLFCKAMAESPSCSVIQGLPGLNGRDGRDGVNGLKGDPGRPGEPGPPGLRGNPGPPGKIGPTGYSGATGQKGEKGINGLPGQNGEKGIGGLPGQKGEKGTDGLSGQKGEKGIGGLPGQNGEKGIGGLPGQKGEKGTDGLSGQKGEKGIGGLPGQKGEKGIGGLPGQKGEKGIGGFPGQKGEKGTGGLPGPSGQKGSKGDSISPSEQANLQKKLTLVEEQLRNLQSRMDRQAKALLFARGSTSDNKIFVTSGKIVTYDESNAICTKAGAKLATPLNDEENKAILEIVQYYNYFTFLGITDIIAEGVFMYANGQPIKYSNWSPGEPNQNGVEDCAEMQLNGAWNDRSCNEKRLNICEFSI